MEYKAALFDLDGVVFDTEPQYTVFWGGEIARYHPDDPDITHRMKGQTLKYIFENWFSGPLEKEREAITRRLNAFERQMDYIYVPGFLPFIHGLREQGIKTALVTSSAPEKMESVLFHHPDFAAPFDLILTARDMTRSKPDPDCYLTAAERLGVSPLECVVFEDSFNGLRAGMDAGMKVIGLTTGHPAEAIASLSHMQVPNFLSLSGDWMEKLAR